MGTYKLASQHKHVGSGTAKLAAFRSAHSNSGFSETNVPTIVEKTEEERIANQKILTTQERQQIEAQKAKVNAAAIAADTAAKASLQASVESGELEQEKEELRAVARARANAASIERAGANASIPVSTPTAMIASAPSNAIIDTSKFVTTTKTLTPKKEYELTKSNIDVLGARIQAREERLRSYDSKVSDGKFVGSEVEYMEYSRVYDTYSSDIENYNRQLSQYESVKRNYENSLTFGLVGNFRMSDEFVGSYVPSYETIASYGNKAFTALGVEDKVTSTKDKLSNYRYASALGGFVKEEYSKFEKAPVETAILDVGVAYAGGFAAGAGFKLGTFATRKALLKGASVAGAGTLAGKGIGLLGASVEPITALGATGYVAKDLYESESEREQIEKIFSYGIGFAGAASGWKSTTRLIDSARVRGRTELPLESIIEKPVIEGIHEFPMTRSGETATGFLSRFKDSEYRLPDESGVNVWHATSSKIGKEFEVHESLVRKKDVPGLYVSPSLSPYFLRLQSGKVPYYKKIVGGSSTLEPTVLRVGIGEVTRMPKGTRYNLQESQKFMVEGAEQGKAYLTTKVERSLSVGQMQEAEAAITPKTNVRKLTDVENYYIDIYGRKVPIERYEQTDYIGDIGKTGMSGKRTVEELGELSKKIDYYEKQAPSLLRPYRPYETVTSRTEKISEYRPTSRSYKEPISRREAITRREYTRPYRNTRYDQRSLVNRENESSISEVEESRREYERRRESGISEISRTAPYNKRTTAVLSLGRISGEGKRKRDKKERNFEWFIENPISSPFASIRTPKKRKRGVK